MDFQFIASCGLVLLGLVITFLAVQKSKTDQFYSDTFWLIPLGVFVWGDGLILGPFWLISGLLFLKMSTLWILRYLLVFVAIRSSYEVVYWLNQQAANSKYQPPLFRNVSWLSAQQTAILYQLINTLALFGAVMGLLVSFQ
jgi:hypothetical protein